MPHVQTYLNESEFSQLNSLVTEGQTLYKVIQLALKKGIEVLKDENKKD